MTKASAFKNAKQIMPTTLLGSNNSHTSSGQNQTAWDMMLLNQAKQLVTNKEK
ncbi:MAG: hypothetical protein HYW78_01815 [Parcubacteria group bacterium]|nr:hypothetical protein [Parcubacteria group bacterium]